VDEESLNGRWIFQSAMAPAKWKLWASETPSFACSCPPPPPEGFIAPRLLTLSASSSIPVDPVNHEDNTEDESLFGIMTRSLQSASSSSPLSSSRDNSEVSAYANNLYVA